MTLNPIAANKNPTAAHNNRLKRILDGVKKTNHVYRHANRQTRIIVFAYNL